jgi:hypothetical protein
MLRHFRILAVMESAAEPWFEDARVKTCIAILQRCDDEAQRMANRVRFVRFGRPLAEIIGVPPTLESEDARQEALERLRERILTAEADCQDQDLRIIIKSQKDLWNDGVSAGTILAGVGPESLAGEYENGDDSEPEEHEPAACGAAADAPKENGNYHAGKWGRYVRAPDLYFEIMRRFGGRMVALGEVAGVRRGITSGCDAFFMPKDITAKLLAAHESDRDFRRASGGAPRKDAESGKLRIVEDGNGVVHPIEARYLAPEVHGPMHLDRPTVRARDLDRVVLLVGEPLDKLKMKSPWVWRYIRYGMTASFASEKSKGKPVPKRPTCAARDPWYDLTGLVKPGIAFWPMFQQYRHIIAANPEQLVGNNTLYDLAPKGLTALETQALVGVLNSTVVGLFKNFYGRYAGTEGALELKIIDVDLLEIPDPSGVSPQLAKRMTDALGRMSQRDVGRLVEEQLMDCHTPDRARRIAAGPLVLSDELQQPDRHALDDAVFELLGVSNPKERDTLIDRLYEATARHFREIRVVEIEKMEQRANSNNKRFSVHDLAADIWDAAELEDATPLAEWIGQRPESDSAANIPEERPAVLMENPLFGDNTVYFGKARKIRMDCPSRGQAELVTRLANLGISGEVTMPAELGPCFKLLDRVNGRLEKTAARFEELAESRTSDDRIREQLMEVLERWFVLGREGAKPAAPPETEPGIDESDAAAGSET